MELVSKQFAGIETEIYNWIFTNWWITLCVILVLLFIFMYNNLNNAKRKTEESFSNIDTYLEQRFDEISALLEQAERAYQHEERTYAEIAALRARVNTARNNGTLNDKIVADNSINSAFQVGMPLWPLQERYPELRSIETLGVHTATRTSSVEENISSARRTYNRNATSFNTKRTAFPTNIIAAIFGFKEPFKLFEMSANKTERPTINNAVTSSSTAAHRQQQVEQPDGTGAAGVKPAVDAGIAPTETDAPPKVGV
ncbi:MAG: LemA family protein [Candidatus Nomurabacteria bacterium]|jgi:LemA protein|nr:LemA family protein [Candidatus Nomurabacteria bacterium]